MAIRQVIGVPLDYIRAICRAFFVGKTEHIPHKYVWMCADMQRFGNCGAEVPELDVPVPFSRAPATAIRRMPINSPRAGS